MKNLHHSILILPTHPLILIFRTIHRNSPQNTTGLLGLKPGKASTGDLEASQIVSPTFVSDKTLIPVVIKPISPEFSSFISFGFGVKTPTFS